MNTREFYDLGFEVEGRIGNAVELQSCEIPGCTPEAIRQAHLAGKPFTGFSTLTLAEGRHLGSLPDGVRLTVEAPRADPGDFDVVVNGIGWKIFSGRLAGALKDVAPADMELLDVPLLGPAGQVLREDFCVVNLLRMLDAISDRKTVRSRDGKSVLKLAVLAAKVPADVHVFRVKQWPWAFVIDELAKRALTKLPHDGLTFLPIEQE
jgi:hypothetical protein